MARIWYSVCGEGLGHAVESSVIIAELMKRHEVEITAADRAYPFLKSRFGRNVHRISGNTFVYEDNHVRIAKSLARFLINLLPNYTRNRRIIRPMLGSFRPEIIISDFESTSNYYSFTRRIPCIGINNNYVFLKCRVQTKGIRGYAWILRYGIGMLHPFIRYFLISSMMHEEPRRPNVFMLPPIIRPEVRKLKTSDRGHGLVYQTSRTNERMLGHLVAHGREYRVYGMGKRRPLGHVRFMGFSQKGFIADLAGCSYVIVNGGFTVISEALFLGKPILSIPVRRQPEQVYNALNVERLGVGVHLDKIKEGDIQAFESRLCEFRKNIKRLPAWEGEDLFMKLEGLISTLTEKL